MNTLHEIKIGTLCNNNCIFCLNEKRDDIVSKEHIFQEIEKCKEGGIDSISFTGGEPAIRKDFFELLGFANKRGMKIGIHSNGRIFSYFSFSKKVLEFCPKDYMVSLHAHNEGLNYKLTRVKGAFRQSVDGIKNLIRLNGQNAVLVNVVVNRFNVNHLKDIAEHHISLGVKKVQFSWVRPQGKVIGNEEKFIPRYKDNLCYLKDACDYILDEGANLSIREVPFCLFDGYKDYIKNPYADMVVFSEDGSKKSADRWVAEKRKVYAEKCCLCDYKDRCSGVFKRYIETFGDGEFD